MKFDSSGYCGYVTSVVHSGPERTNEKQGSDCIEKIEERLIENSIFGSGQS